MVIVIPWSRETSSRDFLPALAERSGTSRPGGVPGQRGHHRLGLCSNPVLAVIYLSHTHRAQPC